MSRKGVEDVYYAVLMRELRAAHAQQCRARWRQDVLLQRYVVSSRRRTSALVHICGGVAQWLGRRSLTGELTYMPDLCLTGDHSVGKLSAMDQPTQPSIPPGSVNSINPCNYMDYGVDNIKRQTSVAYGCKEE